MLQDTLHPGSFYVTLKFIREEIFAVDPQMYKEKVLTYSKMYMENLKYYYNLEIPIIENITKVENSFNHLTGNKIKCRDASTIRKGKNKIELRRILEELGFDINVFFKKSFYQDFLPQYLALVMVYSTLIREIDKKAVQSSSLRAICTYFNLSNYKAMVIKDYLVETLENCSKDPIPRIRYTNEKFRRKLNSLWKATNRVEIWMVIQLFEILGIHYKEFTHKVISFNSKRDAGSFISRLKDHDFSFLRYKAIQRNITKLMELKKITERQNERAINLIEKVLDDKLSSYNPTKNRNIKSKTLTHDSIFYRFKFVEGNLYRIKNKMLQGKIRGLTEKVMNNEYPLDLFNNQGIRCSDFYIEGTRKERINTNTIKVELINPLIKAQRMNYDSKIVDELHRITEQVIDEYKTTRHEPVLTHLLMKMKTLNIISMETPVWYREITGHIDLLGEVDDSLVVIEYKPKEYEIYKGLVQACIYAFLLSKLLKIDIGKIKCLIFIPNIALTYDSTILYQIIKFISNLNSKRENRLTLKNNKPYDIENELLRLVNS